MKEVFVSPGSIALVDDDQFERVKKIKWYLSQHGYALSGGSKSFGIKPFTKMHRFIYGAEDGVMLDHRDGNKLNNQRGNLREATKEQNIHNQKKRTGTNNNYKGTNFVKRLGLWQSRCRMNHEDYFLGYFKSEIAAAYAYNKKALELSEFILLNDLPYNKDYLEKILVSDRALVKKCVMVSPYNFIYFHEKKGLWNIRILFNGSVTYKGGFKTDIEAHEYLMQNYSHMIDGRPLYRKRAA